MTEPFDASEYWDAADYAPYLDAHPLLGGPRRTQPSLEKFEALWSPLTIERLQANRQENIAISHSHELRGTDDPWDEYWGPFG